MNSIQSKLIVLFITLAIPQIASSQDSVANELHFEVNRNYPPLSLTKENLTKAESLIDLNKNYKSEWIREYISVEISASQKGSIEKALGENDKLNQEQKDLINMADLGINIDVNVKYIPENTLSHNEIMEMDFRFTIDPEIEAEYCGGQEQLNEYLKEKAIDKIPDTTFQGYALAAVKFIIDEEGKIKDEEIFWTSEDEKVDELLLTTIRNMPNWKPAEYFDGTKIKQEFVLTVGNMESCVVHLLNIRQYQLPTK